MKIRLDSIKVVGLHRVFMSRVDVIVRRVQQGRPLDLIIVNSNYELLEGADAVHAARRLKFDMVDVEIREGAP